MNELDEDIFIEPSTKDARKMGQMIARQGDGRGLLLEDGTLVIFNSYGHTHDSMMRSLGNYKDFPICIIFILDGRVAVECSFSDRDLQCVFSDAHTRVIQEMYKYIFLERDQPYRLPHLYRI